jgi:hypothetical protein
MIPGPAIIALPLLADHVPPGAEEVSVMPDPAQTIELPVMVPDTGNDTMVIILTAEAVPQPLVTEYEIGVVPPLIPVTTPAPLTVAFELPAVHTPPPTELANVIAAPMHTLSGPLRVPATGNGFTVTTADTLKLPQLVVTV